MPGCAPGSSLPPAAKSPGPAERSEKRKLYEELGEEPNFTGKKWTVWWACLGPTAISVTFCSPALQLKSAPVTVSPCVKPAQGAVCRSALALAP